MGECYFRKSPEILDLQFVFENLLILGVNKYNSHL